jgi:NAD+ diphosphatase
MIAFSAITNRPHEAKGDGIEITEVRWFSRDEMKEAIKTGELLLPPSISVARRMIESWYSAQPGRNLGDLVGGESWRP